MPIELHLNLFGGLTAAAGGRTVEFRPNFTGNLLAYLALNPDRAHPREHLADLLWPDEPDVESARHKLRQTLRQLRLKLDEIEPGLADRALIASSATVRLNRDSLSTDLYDFSENLKNADRATDARERAELLANATSLYKGELLAGFYLEVFEPERDRLAATYRAALKRLLDAFEGAGEYSRAVDVARKAVAEDPVDEDAYCHLMRLHAQLGQPGEVTRHYQVLVRSLQSQLEAEPAPSTRALYESLLDEGRERARDRAASAIDACPRIRRSGVSSAMPSDGESRDPQRPVPRRLRERISPFLYRLDIRVAAVCACLLLLVGWSFVAGQKPRAASELARASAPARPFDLVGAYSYIPRRGEKPNCEPRAVTVDAAGFIYVTGLIQTLSRDVDFLTLKIRPDGKRIDWVETYDSQHDMDRACSLVVDDQGSVYVLGDSYRGKTGLDLVVVKYDPNGRERWATPIDGGFSKEDRPVKILLDESGRLVVGATSWGPSPAHGSGQSDDWLFAWLDPATGAVLMRKRIDGGERSRDALSDFCLVDGNEIFATGAGERGIPGGGVTVDVLTMRIAPDGKPLTRDRYDGDVASQRNRGVRLAWDAARSRLLVAAEIDTGEPPIGGRHVDIALIIYDRRGKLICDHVTHGFPGDDIPLDVCSLPDGSVCVAGRNANDYILYDHGPDETVTPAFHVNGTGNAQDFARQILIGSGGTIYSAGSLTNSGSFSDVALFEHGADGSRRRHVVHDPGGLGDTVAGAAICPDGGIVTVSHSEIRPGLLTIHVAKFRP